MNDVTALMGKLNSTVAYLHFGEPASEPRGAWPILDRVARAQTTDSVETPTTPKPPSAPAPAPAAKTPARLAPTFLRRYGPEPKLSESSRVLADIFAHLERQGR